MTAGDKWVDYSLARPSLASLKAAGIKGVCRYVCYLNGITDPKVIFKPEYDALVAAGFDVLLNYEWYQARMNEGAASGTFDGRVAVQQAKALGHPAGAVIVFSEDTGETVPSAVAAYLDAARAAMGGYYRVGIYGNADIVDAMVGGGHAAMGWQTLAWSNGRVSAKASLYQNGFQSVIGGADDDVVLRVPLYSRLEVLQGADMPLTAADLAAIRQEMIAVLADPTHAYLQDELAPIKDDAQVSRYILNNQVAPALSAVRAQVQALFGAVNDTTSGVAVRVAAAQAAIAAVPTAVQALQPPPADVAQRITDLLIPAVTAALPAATDASVVAKAVTDAVSATVPPALAALKLNVNLAGTAGAGA